MARARLLVSSLAPRLPRVTVAFAAHITTPIPSLAADLVLPRVVGAACPDRLALPGGSAAPASQSEGLSLRPRPQQLEGRSSGANHCVELPARVPSVGESTGRLPFRALSHGFSWGSMSLGAKGLGLPPGHGAVEIDVNPSLVQLGPPWHLGIPLLQDQRQRRINSRIAPCQPGVGVCQPRRAFPCHTPTTSLHSGAATVGSGALEEHRRRSTEDEGLLRAVLARTAEVETAHRTLLLRIEQGGLSVEEMADAGRELSRLEPTAVAVRELKKHLQAQESLWASARDETEDPEFRDMAREEAEEGQVEGRRLLRQVLQAILPRDEADSRGCILEVRAGTGGDEAALFAMDLFTMYQRFSASQGWRFEVVDVAESGAGGCKEASASVSGEGAFGFLKFESGVHRVQRVPATERSGRVHTSAASVAVLPLADEVDVAIRDQDVRVDTFRSGGAGGQSVNTTSSAVRVTHLPTGISVAIQDERSQHQNKAKAFKVLRARLFSMERAKQAASRALLRQTQIGSGDRSERIRTYNFPQGRVTDHRVGLTLHDLEGVLAGQGLGMLLEALKEAQEQQAVASLSAS